MSCEHTLLFSTIFHKQDEYYEMKIEVPKKKKNNKQTSMN